MTISCDVYIFYRFASYVVKCDLFAGKKFKNFYVIGGDFCDKLV